MEKTQGLNPWQGRFGEDYTSRNAFNVKELDNEYRTLYGVSRTELLQEFLGSIEPGKALEIGCNIGTQLMALMWAVRWFDLTGVDICLEALNRIDRQFIKAHRHDLAETLPFKNDYFDLTMHNGVLIHLENYRDVMGELIRVTKPGGYILGFEYWANKYESLQYRDGVFMQRGPFETLANDWCAGGVVKLRYLQRADGAGIDVMYLWRKS